MSFQTIKSHGKTAFESNISVMTKHKKWAKITLPQNTKNFKRLHSESDLDADSEKNVILV